MKCNNCDNKANAALNRWVAENGDRSWRCDNCIPQIRWREERAMFNPPVRYPSTEAPKTRSN